MDSDYDLRRAHVLPLDAAHDEGQLPELPNEETRKALNDQLVRARLKGFN